MPRFFVINDWGELEIWEVDDVNPDVYPEQDTIRHGSAAPYDKVVGRDTLNPPNPRCSGGTRDYLGMDWRYSWQTAD